MGSGEDNVASLNMVFVSLRKLLSRVCIYTCHTPESVNTRKKFTVPSKQEETGTFVYIIKLTRIYFIYNLKCNRSVTFKFLGGLCKQSSGICYHNNIEEGFHIKNCVHDVLGHKMKDCKARIKKKGQK